MTTNQIAYNAMLENKRHNIATEYETQRSNVARETETSKHNRADELIRTTANTEQARHNIATERNQIYAADKNYAASIYTADQHALATRYAADRSYAASTYGAQINAAASRYAADKRSQDVQSQNLVSTNNSIRQAQTSITNTKMNNWTTGTTSILKTVVDAVGIAARFI